MRKLYNHNKGKIHPSPPTTTATATTTDHLSLLPLAVAALAAALAPEDQEVLAYLLSCTTTDKKLSKNTKPTDKTHPPRFNCYCFSCYTSYWVRWDASGNRGVIHEIIDTYEDQLLNSKKNGKNNKKDRKKNKGSPPLDSPHAPAVENVSHAPPQVEENKVNDDDGDDDQDELVVGTSSADKGSIRKFVSFIGERIWGVWGI